jgi:hypothetical protein
MSMSEMRGRERESGCVRVCFEERERVFVCVRETERVRERERVRFF